MASLPSPSTRTLKMLSRTVCRSCLKQLTGPNSSFILPAVSLQSRSSRRHQSTSTSQYDSLKTSLPTRPKVLIYDDLSPRQSHYLNVTLSSFVPSSWLPSLTTEHPTSLPTFSPPITLPPAHHLVYFNPAYPADQLLPDGTDPNQSPGPPFVRRMWAGGAVRWNLDRKIELDGRRWACVEGIRDVTIKGKSGEEKAFVGIERRFGPVDTEDTDGSLRERLWEDKEEQFGESRLIERRNIVFMHERSPEELEKMRKQGATPLASKMLKPKDKPDFTHTLHPTPTLLFRYSALTFNAHAIHLDPLYCREVEGHRNLLFHGPLSFTLLVTMLENQVAKPQGKTIESIEYRNLAPLYCGEPIKLCGREVEGNGGEKYELWAETSEGGIAVKGTARVGASR